MKTGPSDSSRAAELRTRLDLVPHPEGGWYREVFRSAARVAPDDGRESRAALTVIHFLLTRPEHSAWHVVQSDECWIFSEGDPLELLVFDPETGVRRSLELGPASQGREPAGVVPAGCWQAARPLGEFSLVQCTVAPGFDFADFQLIRDSPSLMSLAQALGDWRESFTLF